MNCTSNFRGSHRSTASKPRREATAAFAVLDLVLLASLKRFSLPCLVLGALACSEPPAEESVVQTRGTSPREDLVPGSNAFTLLWQDDFDTFDEERWEAASHTFDQNNAQFSPGQVQVTGGRLTLTLARDSESISERPYLSGEVRTRELFRYGKFETRAKFASGSGVVSSLFTFYDHWSDSALEPDWNELDIEYLGGHPNSIHLNIIHFSEAGYKTEHPVAHQTGWDPSLGFHEYAFEWLPHVVHFYVDGELVHSQTAQIEKHLHRPSKLMMNLWPVLDTAGLNNWAGKFDESALGTTAEYDWVRVSTYDL
jgi:endo-1,3-1,4-beta-glycanase ExoK